MYYGALIYLSQNGLSPQGFFVHLASCPFCSWRAAHFCDKWKILKAWGQARIAELSIDVSHISPLAVLQTEGRNPSVSWFTEFISLCFSSDGLHTLIYYRLNCFFISSNEIHLAGTEGGWWPLLELWASCTWHFRVLGHFSVPASVLWLALVFALMCSPLLHEKIPNTFAFCLCWSWAAVATWAWPGLGWWGQAHKSFFMFLTTFHSL